MAVLSLDMSFREVSGVFDVISVHMHIVGETGRILPRHLNQVKCR